LIHILLFVLKKSYRTFASFERHLSEGEMRDFLLKKMAVIPQAERKKAWRKKIQISCHLDKKAWVLPLANGEILY
jgi:hypothetical protein